MTRWMLFAALATALLGSLGVAQSSSESLSAEQIFERTREAWQGESFHAVVELEITLGDATKAHTLEVWTRGEDLALLRVLEPEEDAGSGYLEVDGKLYYYAPALGSAIELPSIALSEALFGSGPSLDDLSHGTLSDDYAAAAEARDDGWWLTLVPHDDAPVVYGKLEMTVSSDFVLERIVYYDQRDAVLRTATFSDVIEVDGDRFPTRVVIEDASGDRTVQRLVDPEFELDLERSFFTVERLVGGED